jgi:hypothetical protein
MVKTMRNRYGSISNNKNIKSVGLNSSTTCEYVTIAWDTGGLNNKNYYFLLR